MLRTFNILFLCCLLVFIACSTPYIVFFIDTKENIIKKRIVFSKDRFFSLVDKYIEKQKDLGFLAASADSIRVLRKKVYVYIYQGNRYFLDTVFINKQIEEFSFTKGDFFYFEDFIASVEKRINALRCNGYPLANYAIDSVSLTDNHLSIWIKLHKGQYFVFDSLGLPDSLKLSKRFIYGFLRIKYLSPYNQELVNQIHFKINQLRFLTLEKTPQLEFYNGLVKINLDIKTIKVNSLDAIMGLTLKQNKLSTVGYVNIDLYNFFRSAEHLHFSWEKPQPSWQQMEMNFDLPYIYGKPIGFYAKFYNQKIDTSEVNLDLNFRLNYYFKGLNYLSIGYYINSNLTNATDYFDQNVSSYNLSFALALNNLDNFLNPYKGFLFEADQMYGKKHWTDSTSFNMKIRLNAIFFVPISRKMTFRMQINAFWYNSPKIFDNEVVYLGGYDLFRGFDKQLQATSYALFSLEPRILFNRSSYAFIFAEFGKIWTQTVSKNCKTNTLAFGFGFNFRTNNSIIGITYDIGTTNYKFSFRDSKFHISYKALF